MVGVNIVAIRDINNLRLYVGEQLPNGLYNIAYWLRIQTRRWVPEIRDRGNPVLISHTFDFLFTLFDSFCFKTKFLRNVCCYDPVNFVSFVYMAKQGPTTPQGFIIWMRRDSYNNFFTFRFTHLNNIEI